MKNKIITVTLVLFSAFTMFAYDSWNSGKTYPTAGSMVEHNGKVWKNSWWTKGENPDLSDKWGVWKFVKNTVAEPVPPVKPITNNDTVVTTAGNSVVIDVLANDTGNSFNVKSVTSPTNGTAVINNNKIEYTPNSEFKGNDSFEYTIIDSLGALAMGLVSVNVKDSASVAAGKVNATFWSAWGGNTSYNVDGRQIVSQAVDMDKIDSSYNVIITAFIVTDTDDNYVLSLKDPGSKGASTYSEEQIKQFVQNVKNQGRKVIVSMGGQYFHLNMKTQSDANAFVTQTKSIIDKYGFEGLDIDLESEALASIEPTIMGKAIMKVVNHYRNNGTDFWLTAAPEWCYITPFVWGSGPYASYSMAGSFYKSLISAVGIDNFNYIWPQTYNQGPANGIIGEDGSKVTPTSGMDNFLAAMSWAISTDEGYSANGGIGVKIPGSKLAMGIPATEGAAGGNMTYVATPALIQSSLDKMKSQGVSISGFMNWSVDWDAVRINDGDLSTGYSHFPWETGRAVAQVLNLEEPGPIVDPTPDPIVDPTPDPIVDPVPVLAGAWNSTTVYNNADIVAYNGKTYKAGWWTQGQNPELSGQWGVWKVTDDTVTPDPVVDPTPDPVVDPTPDPDPVVDPDPVIDPEPTPDPVTPVNGDKNIGGYFAEWGIYGRDYQVTDLPVKYLTHINYAFLNIENGIPVLGDPWAAIEKRYPEVVTEYGVYPAHSWEGTAPYYGNIARLNTLDELVNDYYGKDIKILFSVGGWSWSENFPEMVATYESRAKFLAELVRMIKLYKFEGVSYDWEYPVIGPQFAYNEPRIEEAEQFQNLIRETRLAFDDLSAETGIQYEITIAMSANPVNLEYLDLTALAAYADNFDVMTYDYAAVSWGSGAQHQSPLFDNPENPNPDYHDFNVNNICQYLISQGVDSKRIMVGCPAYGRSGSEVFSLFQPSGVGGPGTWEKANLDYDSIMGRSTKFNVDTNPDNYKWDDIAKASYYLSDDGTFISYDSPRAIKEKCKYINEQDLGGLFIWEFSNDRNNDILKTAHDNLNANM